MQSYYLPTEFHYLVFICQKHTKKQSVVLNNRPHLLATLELTIVNPEFQEASWSSGTLNSNLKFSGIINSTDFSKFSC